MKENIFFNTKRKYCLKTKMVQNFFREKFIHADSPLLNRIGNDQLKSFFYNSRGITFSYPMRGRETGRNTFD